jgi:hypothetical protein
MPNAIFYVFIVALIINNVAWMLYLHEAEKETNKKEQILLNRIQAPTYLTPNETEDTTVVSRPSTTQLETHHDAEYQAVGKINPDYVNESRNGKE